MESRTWHGPSRILRRPIRFILVLAGMSIAAGLASPPAFSETKNKPLAPLAKYLGPHAEIGFVSWKPVDFKKAAEAGFTTVWMGTRNLLELPEQEQQEVLQQADQSGLRRIGFISGDPAWLNPNFPSGFQKARAEHEQLSATLERYFKTHHGVMKVVLAVDIEPYVKRWWDGDLARYSDLLDTGVVPIVSQLANRYPDRVEKTVTRFEPFWWENGHITDSDKTVRGLRDFPSVVAVMSYRNSAEGLFDVSSHVRKRARQADGMTILLGAETKPPGTGIPEFITFHGRENILAAELVRALSAMPLEDRKRFQGVFIHSGKKEADSVLSILSGDMIR